MSCRKEDITSGSHYAFDEREWPVKAITNLRTNAQARQAMDIMMKRRLEIEEDAKIAQQTLKIADLSFLLAQTRTWVALDAYQPSVTEGFQSWAAHLLDRIDVALAGTVYALKAETPEEKLERIECAQIDAGEISR